ncbi:MAG TPA: ester cyclase [Candidatus Limnocylindrales bacterium]|nr:ester cyclase [Candidatus Limnocylindrales bacterium]
MTSLREPSTDVPATSDELEEQRHLELNKEVARQVVERIFVKGEDGAIDELISTEFKPYTFGPMPPGREGLREGMRRAHQGVSDPEFTIHEMVAEGDKVAVRLSTSARHTGTFMGLPPTGRRYQIDEMHIFGIRDGQVVEHWHVFDKGDLMRQLTDDPAEDGGGKGVPPAKGGGGAGHRENRDEWDIE